MFRFGHVGLFASIRVNQAPRCRVFISGKGTGALNRDEMERLLYLIASGFARVFPFQNSTTGQVSRSCPDQGHLGPVAGRGSRSDSGPTSGGQQQQPCAGYGCGSKKGTSMSFKSKVLAGAATLALVGGVGTAGALSASAATPSCGRELHQHLQPRLRDAQAARTSRSTCSARARRSASRSSCSRRATPTRQWTSSSSFQGMTSDFFAAGLVSSAVKLHYGCSRRVRRQ